MSLSTAPDLEHASAQDVIAYAVERFGSRLTMACSFQKEESVLVHMTAQIAPDLRIFSIDTGVLFPETFDTWNRFEERYGVRIETVDARSPDDPWTQTNCCGAAKVDGLNRALEGYEAWITGIRREQAPTRAAAPKVQFGEGRGIWKVNPLADWTEKDLWRYIFAHDLPYHPLHDQSYASIGCAPCTLPGNGREGRWAGEDKTECGLHVTQSGPLDPVS
jgi:phosphoadenosine phosphosulfate reductase